MNLFDAMHPQHDSREYRIRLIALAELPSFDFLRVEPAMVRSIKTDGVLVPITVRYVNDRWRVLAGRRRIEAARKAGLMYIPAVVADATFPDDAIVELVENALRSENKHSDWMAIKSVFQRVLEETGSPPTPADIAHLTGVPVAKVKARLRYFNLLPELLKAFERGVIGATVATKLSSMSHTLQTEAVGILQTEGKLTAAMLADLLSVQRSKLGATLSEMNELFPQPIEACDVSRHSRVDIIACALGDLSTEMVKEVLQEVSERIGVIIF